MDSKDNVDIVAIGAHPDDTEIGVGGTLAKFARQGIRTGIIDLTNAEPTPLNDKYRSPEDFDPDYAERRIQESKRAAEILGISRKTLDLPNRRLMDNFEARCALATVFREWKPKIVIVILGRTVMASPDHYQAQLITEAAVFYSRLTKWEKFFSGLPVHRIRNLLYYPVRSATVNMHPEGYTSFFIDVSEVIDLKRRALESYSSQFQEQGHGNFIDLVVENNKALGNRVGAKYAEHLCSPFPIKINDLLTFFG